MTAYPFSFLSQELKGKRVLNTGGTKGVGAATVQRFRTLMRIFSVLGFESDLDLIAHDDKLGRLLQDNELKPRRRPPT